MFGQEVTLKELKAMMALAGYHYAGILPGGQLCSNTEPHWHTPNLDDMIMLPRAAKLMGVTLEDDPDGH